MKQWIVLAGFIALCLGVGALAGLVTAPAVAEWYPTLVKPWWRPPNWLFGPAWTVLYIMMAVAAWLVWRVGDAKPALILWAGQPGVELRLVLPVLWGALAGAGADRHHRHVDRHRRHHLRLRHEIPPRGVPDGALSVLGELRTGTERGDFHDEIEGKGRDLISRFATASPRGEAQWENNPSPLEREGPGVA